MLRHVVALQKGSRKKKCKPQQAAVDDVTIRGVEGIIKLAPAVGKYSIAMPNIYLQKP